MALKKRLTRQESRARTQALLLEAAGKTFRKVGFEGAAVEDIAETAGFSRGAFYANFESKDDLFIALLDHEMKAHCEKLKLFLDGDASPREVVERVRQFYTQFNIDNREHCMLMLEAQLYAIRNPKFRARVAQLLAQEFEDIRETIVAMFEAMGKAPPVPPEQIAKLAMATKNGLTMQQMTDPKFVTDDFIESSLGLLFDYFITRHLKNGTNGPGSKK